MTVTGGSGQPQRSSGDISALFERHATLQGMSSSSPSNPSNRMAHREDHVLQPALEPVPENRLHEPHSKPLNLNLEALRQSGISVLAVNSPDATPTPRTEVDAGDFFNYTLSRWPSTGSDESRSSSPSSKRKPKAFVQTRARTQFVRSVPNSRSASPSRSNAVECPSQITQQSPPVPEINLFGAFRAIAKVLSDLQEKVPYQWFLHKEIVVIEANALELAVLFAQASAFTQGAPNPSVEAAWKQWSAIQEARILGAEDLKGMTPFVEKVLSTLQERADKDADLFFKPSPVQNAKRKSGSVQSATLLLSVTTFNNNIPSASNSFKEINSLFAALVPLIGVLGWQVSFLCASVFAGVIVLIRIGIWIHTQRSKPNLDKALSELREMSEKLRMKLESLESQKKEQSKKKERSVQRSIENSVKKTQKLMLSVKGNLDGLTQVSTRHHRLVL